MYGFAATTGARVDDRIYNCLPMYHSNGGLIGLGVALAAGGSCYIRERFSVQRVLERRLRHDCTMFIYVGELCRYLYNAPPSDRDRAHRIRLVRRQRAEAGHFRRVSGPLRHPRSLEFYAATEGNVVLFNFDSTPARSVGCPAGRPSASRSRSSPIDVDAEHRERDAQGRCIECGDRRARRTAR